MTGRTFGVLSPYVEGDYFGAIIAGINAAAAAAGDRIVAIQTLDPGAHVPDRDGLPDFRRPVAWRHVAGLARLPGSVDMAYVQAARAAGLPVVLVAEDGTAENCSSVGTDNRSGAREAVEHLIGHGHDRIAFAGFMDHADVRERYVGYRQALFEHRIAARPELLFEAGDNLESGGERVGEQMLRAGMPATAVLTGTDRNAIGLTRRLRGTGRRIPDDLAVVGFDDIVDTRFETPSMSTVCQPLDELGALVHELLRDLADDPGRPVEHRETLTRFVKRGSCGCTDVGLTLDEAYTRTLFAQVQYLQRALKIQHELGVELLGPQEREPRRLGWLELTPAAAGCLGMWPGSEQNATDTDPPIEITGEFRADGPAGHGVGKLLPVSAFPTPELIALPAAAAGETVFVVPVRSGARDWGLLAAVGRIQATTPPGREMMNQAGTLLAAALDRGIMVASLREKEESLRNAALHDHLTGLPNRVLLEDRLNQAQLRATRNRSHRFAVMLLDLDGFKAVNDSYGHAAGDRLLKEVASRLTGLLRKSDTVARLGGDEFVVLLDGVTTLGWQQKVTDSITETIRNPFLIDGHLVQVGVSIGVAVSDAGPVDPDQLLREADAAMYRVKSLSRRR